MTYPLVPIGAFARPVARSVEVKPTGEYPLLGVRWYGAGAHMHDRKLGAALSAPTLFQARAGDVIINKIWVRNGSSGIVPQELDGCFATSEFPMFELDQSVALPEWLSQIFRAPSFWRQCDAKSQGTSGKNRIKPAAYLSIPVPLPPLAEQRRVVGRLQGILAAVAECGSLGEEVRRDSEILGRMTTSAIIKAGSIGARSLSIADLGGTATSGPRGWGEHVGTGESRFYRAQDITKADCLAAEGVFVAGPHGTNERAEVRPGDVLTVITGATIGRCALVDAQHPAGFVSQHVGLIRLPRGRVLPEWVWWCLRSPEHGRAQLLASQYGQGKPGLNLHNLRSILLPVPSLAEQARLIVSLADSERRFRAMSDARREAAIQTAGLSASVLAAAFSGRL